MSSRQVMRNMKIILSTRGCLDTSLHQTRTQSSLTAVYALRALGKGGEIRPSLDAPSTG